MVERISSKLYFNILSLIFFASISVFFVNAAPVAGTLTYTTAQTGPHTLEAVDGVYDAGYANKTDSLEELKISISGLDSKATKITNISLNGISYGTANGWNYDSATNTWNTRMSAGYPFYYFPYQEGINTLTATFSDSPTNKITLSLKVHIVSSSIFDRFLTILKILHLMGF